MTDIPPQPPPALPFGAPLPQLPLADLYATFAGLIDQQALQRFFQGLTAVTAQSGIGMVHVLFNTTGGTVGEGIALYNFLRTFPIDLTVYNAGGVQSVGVIAYLGGKKRKVSANAAFMMHRTHVSPQFATATRLHAFTDSLRLDDQRTEAILRHHLTLSKKQWKTLDAFDLWIDADEAVKTGLAHEIGDFSSASRPPHIFNLIACSTTVSSETACAESRLHHLGLYRPRFALQPGVSMRLRWRAEKAVHDRLELFGGMLRHDRS